LAGSELIGETDARAYATAREFPMRDIAWENADANGLVST
jgi:hypothetical protein